MKKINFYLSIMYYGINVYITGISIPDSIGRNSATDTRMWKMWENELTQC